MAWDDEDSDGSPPPAVVKKSKFDDEEEEEAVADAWDADDSEEEREKAKKKAEADAKRAAELAASKKPKTQRIAERQAEHAAERERLAQAEEEEDPALARERARQMELEADLAAAGDLLGAAVIGSQARRSAADRSLIQYKTESGDQVMLDLSDLPLFQPRLKGDFDEITKKLVPLFVAMQKKGHYPIFLQEFFRETAKGLSSEQIKKLGSALTTLSNEKMREEKAADTKGKKTTKAKTKATVTLGGAGAGKSHVADTTNYDNEIDDYDDFM